MKKMLFFVLLTIIILSILFIKNIYDYDSCYKIDSYYINKYPLKCCVLLTMYIGGNIKRKQTYLHRINRWLNETSFDIYTVESSGELLNIIHPRLKQFTFIQGEEFKGNSTILERNSLLKAHNYFKNDFKKYDIILKITAKYFIPSLESLIKHIKPDTELLFQYSHSKSNNIQNTEITGYKSNIFYDITNRITNKGIYESQIEKYSKKYKTYRLPKLYLEEFTERGDGIILKYL